VTFPALGKTATLLVTDDGTRHEAHAILVTEIDAIEVACSPSCAASELAVLNAIDGGRRWTSPSAPNAISARSRSVCASTARRPRLAQQPEPVWPSAPAVTLRSVDHGAKTAPWPSLTITARHLTPTSSTPATMPSFDQAVSRPRIPHFRARAVVQSSCTAWVDPVTALSAAQHWRTLTVTAASYVVTGIARTASLVVGADAPTRLAACSAPARLVAGDGTIATADDWQPGAEAAW